VHHVIFSCHLYRVEARCHVLKPCIARRWAHSPSMPPDPPIIVSLCLVSTCIHMRVAAKYIHMCLPTKYMHMCVSALRGCRVCGCVGTLRIGSECSRLTLRILRALASLNLASPKPVCACLSPFVPSSARTHVHPHISI